MKRPRSDSAASAVRAMQNATRGAIRPPAHVHLRPGDLPFWEAVVRARARDEWAGADLVICAQLARCQADVEREQAALDAEGWVIDNAGRPTVNPRSAVVDMLAKREMALLRTLRLGGRESGDGRDSLKAAQVERRSRQVLADLDDFDDLIAR